MHYLFLKIFDESGQVVFLFLVFSEELVKFLSQVESTSTPPLVGAGHDLAFTKNERSSVLAPVCFLRQISTQRQNEFGSFPVIVRAKNEAVMI